EMERISDRATSWKLRGSGFGTLRGGLEGTYAKCRRAMAEAKHTPTAEALHEWRKHVKYNRAHLRLLRGLWPEVIEPLRVQSKLLSDALGFDHDLAVLADTIAVYDNEAPAGQELIKNIQKLRAELRREAFQLGPLLFAQSPRDYGRHAKALWVQRKVPAD
ncbi:MAG: CHAD domain-containing protein, partial [Planctomycetota bacterium]